MSFAIPVTGTGDDFDASDVTWAHAVNSKASLQNALQGNVTFLEADISVGNLTGDSKQQAIMAHPPITESDISLDQWLWEVYNHSGPQKGIKLDFKSDVALQMSLPVLLSHKTMMDDAWLNADVIPGPVDASPPGVTPSTFADICLRFTESTISPGWSTSLSEDEDRFFYSWKDTWLMSRTLFCATDAITIKPKKFTFPVRAIFLKRSVPQLAWLTSVINDSTLTVWSSIVDPLNTSDLLDIRRGFPKSKVYYDLPEYQSEEFVKIKDTTVYNQSESFNPELWAILRLNSEPFGCDDQTTVSRGIHIVYGGSGNVAVVLNSFLIFPIEIKGRFRPYTLPDYQGNYTSREGYVALVLANNKTFWEDSWTRDDGSRTALALNIADPSHNYSECWIDWKLTMENELQPMLVTYSGDCAVNVWTNNLTVSADSGIVMGFVFSGPRAMVMEAVSVKTEVPLNTTEVPPKPSGTRTLHICSPMFIIAVVSLLFAIL